MKASIKSLICILLSFMCLFACVGYAAVSSNLTIWGKVETEFVEGIFITNITDVTDPDNSNIDKNEFDFFSSTTMIENTISRGAARAKGVVEYEVTVHNNTDITYYYRDIDFQTRLPGYNGNDYISDLSPSISIGVDTVFAEDTMDAKKINPRSKIVFTVKYTIGEGMNADLDWKMLINIRFGINVEGEDEAIEAVEEGFLRILNTSSTYEQLIDILDNKYDGINGWTSNYIGNVVGSFSDDSVAVNNLFAGQLQLTVGGVPRDATVLIKHENVDGELTTGDDYVAVHPNGGRVEGKGCEMTLYLTIDPLTASGQYVPVYAVVFTCDRDAQTGERLSDWYRVGKTYAGEADVVTYDGNYGTGSFVTDRWRATPETYTLVDGYSFNIDGERYNLNGYSYSLTQGTRLYQILQMEDSKAVKTAQTLLDDAKRILDNREYAGEGIDRIREVYERYSSLYTVDANGKHTINNYWPMRTFGKLSPAIVDLYRVVNAALTNISQLP